MSDRIMFSEMKIGGVYENVPLVVIQATPKVSKNGKNYLSMILSDGKNQLPCKYWDWGGNNLPEKNTIYDFNLECDEYNSTKQLICRKVMRNTDNTINDFLKNVEIDIDTLYENALLLANGIEDDFYREITVEAMTRYKKRWLTVPASKRNHHAFPGGMLLHSYNVAMMSKMNAAFMKGAWTDLAVAGGLLHDIGKLFEYVQAGIEIEITDVAILMDHLFIGAEIVKDLAKEKIHSPKDREKLRLLQHIILSHHREREYGAIVYPKTIEAWIVAHADALDAECQAIREANEKIARRICSQNAFGR